MYPCAFDPLFTKSVPHILEKIFFSLNYESFKICRKVSNSWNELLTSESFKTMGTSVFREVIERELHEASEDGNLTEVRSILTSGMVDVNCIGGRWDSTPLYHASWKGHTDVVRLLLDAGAEPSTETEGKRTEGGATPLLAAAQRCHNDVVQLLLDRGAEPNITLLHYASCQGYKTVVQLLLEKGADPNNVLVAVDGKTPLHFSAREGHRDVVEALLDGGAEPNRADINGRTPLHHASYHGHKNVVQLLVARGADLNDVTANGYTPLFLALNKGHIDIVNILQDAGALL